MKNKIGFGLKNSAFQSSKHDFFMRKMENKNRNILFYEHFTFINLFWNIFINCVLTVYNCSKYYPDFLKRHIFFIKYSDYTVVSGVN